MPPEKQQKQMQWRKRRNQRLSTKWRFKQYLNLAKVEGRHCKMRRSRVSAVLNPWASKNKRREGSTAFSSNRTQPLSTPASHSRKQRTESGVKIRHSSSRKIEQILADGLDRPRKFAIAIDRASLLGLERAKAKKVYRLSHSKDIQADGSSQRQSNQPASLGLLLVIWEL